RIRDNTPQSIVEWRCERRRRGPATDRHAKQRRRLAIRILRRDVHVAPVARESGSHEYAPVLEQGDLLPPYPGYEPQPIAVVHIDDAFSIGRYVEEPGIL